MFYMTTGIHDPWCPEQVFFCVFAEENGSVANADVNDTLQDVEKNLSTVNVLMLLRFLFAGNLINLSLLKLDKLAP